MHSTTAIGAAALLALVPSALALGQAKVVNNCGDNVFFASVPQNIAVAMAELPNSGYSESYSLPNVGVSIKLSPSMDGEVTQFEYTWAGSNIYYDISNINGYLFSAGGMSLVPSEAGCEGYPTCQAIVCEAGQTTCSAAYNQPDDVRTMVCPDSSDLTFTLCPNNSNSTATSTSQQSGTQQSGTQQSYTPAAANYYTAPTPELTGWVKASKREAEPHSHGHRIHARHLK